MTDLPNDIDSLKILVKELLKENAQLKSEIAELRRRFNLDSDTSHKPPSSDGYKKKTVKPGIPKEKKKPNGGQKGHLGNTLKRVEHPKHKQNHLPEQCHNCKRHFNPAEIEIIQSRQVFDIVTPTLTITDSTF